MDNFKDRVSSVSPASYCGPVFFFQTTVLGVIRAGTKGKIYMPLPFLEARTPDAFELL